MPHKLELSQGACFILRSWLKTSGWATSVDKIMLGGQLLVLGLPQVETAPQLLGNDRGQVSKETVALYEKDHKEWSDKVLSSVDLSDKQRDCIKDCIKWVVENKMTGSNESVFQLLVALGYDKPI